MSETGSTAGGEMSKRLHPIQKLRRRLGASPNWNSEILRAVKPLLDALERDGHGVMFTERKDVVRCKHIGGCFDCRLLAAWKEPLK